MFKDLNLGVFSFHSRTDETDHLFQAKMIVIQQKFFTKMLHFKREIKPDSNRWSKSLYLINRTLLDN